MSMASVAPNLGGVELSNLNTDIADKLALDERVASD
jgi:hypothetical protein